jgi:hypothetical protein
MRYLLMVWLLCWAAPAQAALCTLAWDANIEEDLAGYRVYHAVTSHGQAIGSPNASVGVATTATCEQIGVTQDGLTHYVVVTALDLSGLEGGSSNEVSIVLPVVGPPPPPPVDTDGDGIIDSLDGCPTQPGPSSNNGCPIIAPPPPPPPPPPVCIRMNKHGRCTKWGTVPLASVSHAPLDIPFVMDAEDEPEKGTP